MPRTPRTPINNVPLQTKTRAMSAADAAAADAAAADAAVADATVAIVTTAATTVTNTVQENESGTGLQNSGTVNQTNTDDAPLINLESSSSGPYSAGDDITMVPQTIFLDMLATLKETQSQLAAERLHRRELEAALQCHTEQQNQLEVERQRRQEVEEALQHRSTEERDLTAALRARDAELIESRRTIEQLSSLRQQFSQMQQHINQISSNITTRTSTNHNTNIFQDRLDASSSRNISVPSTDLSLGYNLKPDTFDGTTSLSEYLNQFNLIAKANNWNDDKKTVALVASLRDKAKSVLVSFKDSDTLDWKTLLERLEVRFGEHFGTNSYSLLQNRRQKLGEDLQSLAADIIKLTTLAYPECPMEIQDKIACCQFIIGIYDNNVRKTLQLEGITSLKIAVARAVEVKNIEDQNRYSATQRNRNFQNENLSEKNTNNNDKRIGQGQSFNRQEWLKNLECWTCHKKGHAHTHCPNQGN